jgi:hypothetical protein
MEYIQTIFININIKSGKPEEFIEPQDNLKIAVKYR